MRSKSRLICLLVFILMLVITVSAQAVVSGNFNIMGDVKIDATHFDWLPLGGVGTQDFIIGFSPTGTFAGLSFTTGSEQDLDLALTPVDVPLSLNNYLALAALPGVSFELNFIFPGQNFSSPGTNTSDALTLTDIPTGVILAWGVQMAVSDGIDPAACYTGTYSSQINAMTSSELLALLGSGGFITSTYSASFSACPTVPLPGTASLVITGLVGLYCHLSRRCHKSQQTSD